MCVCVCARAYRRVGQEVNALGDNLLTSNIESLSAQSINQNSPTETPRRSQEAASVARDPNNLGDVKSLVDGLSPDLMAKL